MSICKSVGTSITTGGAERGAKLSRCEVWRVIWILAWHSVRYRYTYIRAGQ